MNQVGSIPHAGQTFQWNDLLFEVLDMDGLRIDKILVSRNSEKTPPAGGDK